ncbi:MULTISPECIES: hypothetical protein [Pseudoalteromonas]|uniref:Lipoprotein n=1 Tax=Pseudoalteromonas amylolytica TaxID=1859457 RepID=A0A1S1MPE3_9GAMM|nr:MULTISPECIES: hypothetical protein [Pseudoalteromonas]MCF6437272.1 hypothetical protein [Pseudoalteromonas sp. MMG022]OHU84374.1 hypothetical protein BFC16_01670 [Pseudoalteromonas sp. JW3]OHU87087.1 hypothetical protein BET10_00270 [Pseudoalteromonas amylolytica]
MKSLLTAITTTVLLSACAHHDDVRPGNDNQHYVVIKSVDRSEGIKEALGQATHYCEQSQSNMVVLNETIDYKGELPEHDYLKTRATAEFVTEAGSWLWIIGDGHVDDVAAVAAVAGAGKLHSMGAPYFVTVNFRCT